jgi:hypothetical protein
VSIGGFTVAPNNGVVVWDTGTMLSTALDRFPNATIDDVFIFDLPGGASGKAANQRYESNNTTWPTALVLSDLDSAVSFNLELPIPLPLPTATARGRYEVATVYVNFETPVGCAARATLSGTTRNLFPPPAPAAPLDGLGVEFGGFTELQVREFHDDGEVNLTVRLAGDGVKSPVLENVTMYLLHPVELIEDDEQAPVE